MRFMVTFHSQLSSCHSVSAAAAAKVRFEDSHTAAVMVKFELGGYSYELDLSKFLGANVFYFLTAIAGCFLLRMVGKLVGFVQQQQQQQQLREDVSTGKGSAACRDKEKVS